MANYYDLNPSQTKSSDGKYIDLVFTGFVPNTDYGLTFAWIYEDPTLGISGESNLFNFKTIATPPLNPPQFRLEDLYAINSTLYISWNGKDATGNPYATGKLKKVNVWIKGGDFGETYVQHAHSFTSASQFQIVATKKATYCIKLQAESNEGKFSEFSDEFCVTLLKQPKAVYDVRHEWDASGNLSVFWKFDPTLKDADNDNTMADSFGLQLLQPQGGPHTKDGTWWTSVEKDKIPPLEQKIVISASTLQGVFGQTSAFDTDYDSAIYVRDKNLQTSYVTGYALSKYSDPLTPPVISATGAPMAYNVAYTANSTFDKIYVYESLDNGVTWSSTPFVTSSNPAYVPTLNSLSRKVRAKFSKRLGGFTDYSNIVSVTPTAIDPTDTVAPVNPTNISATATVDANDKTGFSLQATISFTKSTDLDCRGYRIRWTTQTTNPIYEYGYVDHPTSGNTVSFTVSGLIPNITYYYQVASVDQFNNTQTYSTAGTFTAQDSVATAEGSLARLKSYISIGGATGDQFKFGTGIAESINISTTTTPSLSSGTYHGLLLNKTGNKNNFWLTTGQLRVGTDTQFMYFDGTNLYLTGDINAKSGTISGNLNITTGSLIAGTTNGPRVNVNSTGIFAYGNITVNGTPTLTQTTQIIGNATTDAPTFITTKANIANWLVDSTTIKAGGITLDSSSPSIIATNSGSYVGIKPRSSGGTDIVLWAGNTSSPAANSATSGQAGFQVNADGQLYASGAIIKGVITADSGSSLGGLLADTSKVFYQNTKPASTSSYTLKKGDVWVDTGNGYRVSVYDVSDFVLAQDSATALATANSKNKTYYATSTGSGATIAPTGVTGAASGDLWINTSSGNKPYRYNGSQWTLVQDSGAADGSTALQKAGLFGTDAALVSALKIQNTGAAIYSQYGSDPATTAKSSYGSSNNGFYLGWDVQSGVLYPAIDIGNSNAYLRYSNFTQVLDIKGKITATEGSFTGNVTAGPVTIGPNGISTSTGKFTIDSSGNASFSGTITGSTFTLATNGGNNYWNNTSFRAGSSSTYLDVHATTGVITAYSTATQNELSEGGSNDGTSTSSTTSISIPQQILVDTTSVKIQGIPGVGNGLTAIGSLEYGGSGTASYNITQYNDSSKSWYTVTSNYGAAARYRTVIADPYDSNRLKRGFGVYYGSRSSAPGASTGYVGDIWISW